MESNERPQAPPDPGPVRPRKGLRSIFFFLLIAAALLAAILLLLRDRTPPLDEPAYEHARKLWAAAGIADYDLDLTVQFGAQGALNYRVAVRGGKTTSFSIDGTERPANDAYSIRGLFAIIERELDMASGKAPAAGIPAGATLRGEFDERYGYPRVFKRLAPDRRSCFITVNRFEPSPGR